MTKWKWPQHSRTVPWGTLTKISAYPISPNWKKKWNFKMERSHSWSKDKNCTAGKCLSLDTTGVCLQVVSPVGNSANLGKKTRREEGCRAASPGNFARAPVYLARPTIAIAKISDFSPPRHTGQMQTGWKLKATLKMPVSHSKGNYDGRSFCVLQEGNPPLALRAWIINHWLGKRTGRRKVAGNGRKRKEIRNIANDGSIDATFYSTSQFFTYHAWRM